MRENTSLYLFIFIIILFSAFALKDLWGPQFFTSHDGQSHMARLYQYDKLLKDGQIPPRWAGQFAGERGYPVFVFAYPLPYAVGELFYIFGFNLAESLKLVFALFYILSGIGMYFLVKEIFKNNLAAFISAVLLLWAPYRFVKIFVTASLGESAAFAFIPLILLFIYKFVKKPAKISFIGLVLSLAGLILTHLITLIIFFPLFLSFTAWCLWQNKEWFNKLKFLVLAGLTALGLSSFYLIPAVYEIRYTRYREVLTKNYYQQFVEPIKLLYSRWGYGVPKITPDELSLQVGFAQWLAVGLSIGLIAFLFFKKNKLSILRLLLSLRDLFVIAIPTLGREKQSQLNCFKNKIATSQTPRNDKHKVAWLGIIFLFNFFLSIFLMLSVSKPVWDLLPPLQSVDTPWRFLSLAVFSSAFLGGFSIWAIGKFCKKYHWLLASGCWLLLVFLAFYTNRNHLRINASVDWDERYFANYYWVGSGWDEYRPKWIKDTYHKPPKRYVEILDGDCKVNNLKRKSNLISFNIDCQADSQILLHHAYYPGWKITVNNQDKTKEVISNLEESQGLIMFDVNKDVSKVMFKFGETNLRLIADLISIGSLLFLLFYFNLKFARRRLAR